MLAVTYVDFLVSMFDHLLLLMEQLDSDALFAHFWIKSEEDVKCEVEEASERRSCRGGHDFLLISEEGVEDSNDEEAVAASAEWLGASAH